MDKDLKDFIKKTCRDQSRTLVGRICKQIEILQEHNDSKETKKVLDLLKSFNKELIYEEFRDLNNAIIFYAEGREYKKVPIFKPLKDK